MSFIIKFKGKNYLAIFKLQIMVIFEIFTKQTINFSIKAQLIKICYKIIYLSDISI